MAIDLNTSPYFDDFDETKNYLRILFNPSRAVQARELTQVQTILQGQIRHFSKHIFADGTPILGSKISVNDKRTYISVTGDTVNDLIDNLVDSDPALTGVYIADESDVTNKAYIDSIDTVNGRIYYTTHSGSVDVAAVFSAYTSTDVLIPDTSMVVDTKHNYITANITDGLVYLGGSFVIVSENEADVNLDDTTGKYYIGYRFTDSLVESDDDSTLLDPASGSYNYNAPGADRYKGECVLTSYLDGGSVPEDFYMISIYENGETITAVNNVQYSDILDLLARRTYDQSGDYSVNPIDMELKFIETPTVDEEKQLEIKLGTGKAYVRGYEIDKRISETLYIDKARTTEDIINEQIYAEYGVYIDLVLNGIVPDCIGAFNIGQREEVKLWSDVSGGGTEITTTRIVAITPYVDTLRIWLEWSPSIASFLKSTSSITGVTSSAVANVDVFDTDNQPENHGLAFSFEREQVKEIDNTSFDYTVLTQYSLTGTDVWTQNISQSNRVFASSTSTEVVLFDGAGGYVDPSNYTVDNSAQTTITITGTGGTLVPGTPQTINVVVKEDITGGIPRVKTLTSTSTNTIAVDSVILPNDDFYRVTTVTNTTDSLDVPLTDIIITDGATDVMYGKTTVSGLNAAKNYTIDYEYFAHSEGSIKGDAYTVDSYVGATEGSDLYRYMPTYISNDSRVHVSNRNVVDFRRTEGELAGSVSVVEPRTNITCSYTQYLSRLDKVYLDSQGNYGVSTGIPSNNPETPKDIPGTMSMYIIDIPSYTLEPNAVEVTDIDKKTFTMDDIRDIVKRVENLEYYTSLNMLEKAASEMNILDELGNSRFKNGILVDNFTSHDVSNVIHPDYVASLDFEDGTLRGSFTMNNVDINVDYAETEGARTTEKYFLDASRNLIDYDGGSNTPTGIAKGVTTWHLSHTTDIAISASAASGVTNVNPFNVFHFEGSLDIVPKTDNWVSTYYLPTIQTGSGSRLAGAKRTESLNRNIEPIWNAWRNSIVGKSTRMENIPGNSDWSNPLTRKNRDNVDKMLVSPEGRKELGLSARPFTPRETTSVTTTVTGSQRRGWLTTGRTTTERRVSDRLVSRDAFYFMRSRNVTFSAEGLVPNYKHKLFFDGIDISTSLTTVSDGTVGDNVKTDATGACTGTFNIPANKFKAGTPVVVKLVDYDNTGADSVSSSETEYEANGTLNTTQRTVTTVTTVTPSRWISTWAGRTNWSDPVAQTFLVEDGQGIYLDKIDLFFQTKSTKNIPVSIMIVENENGIPTQNMVPFSQVTVNPSDITVSDDGQTSTEFVFGDPVYLQPSVEYSFIVMSNSNEYTMFVGEIGKQDIFTNEVIMKQPYAGVMLISQNGSTWTPDQTKDVKFDIHKCVFENPAGFSELDDSTWANFDLVNDASYYDEINGDSVAWTTDKDLVLMNLNIEDLEHPKTGIVYDYALPGNNGTLLNKENTSLDTVETLSTTGGDLTITSKMSTTDVNISPVINDERTSAITVDNTSQNPIGNIAETSVYITEATKLTTSSDDLKVIFDAVVPFNSEIDVYYKTSEYVPKYVDLIPASLSIGAIDDVLVNNTCNIQYYDTTTVAGSTGNIVKGSVFVTRIDDDTGLEKMYISNATDFQEFDPTVVPANNVIFVTEEVISTIYEFDSSGGHSIGDYVQYDSEIYKSKIGSNTNTPTSDQTDDNWTHIISVVVDPTNGITEDDRTEWRPMKQTNVVADNVNTYENFVEYTYDPKEYPDEDFSEFSVKIVLKVDTTTRYKVPQVKNFRAIATM